jgi:hypothetical protein
MTAILEAFNYVTNLPIKYKVIAGDFNMPDIIRAEPSAPVSTDFLSTIHVGGWKQLVHSPTRLGKVLDVVFTLNIPGASATVGQRFPGSDHKVVYSSLKLPYIINNGMGSQMESSSKTNAHHPGILNIQPSQGSLHSVDWKLFESLLRQLNWDEFFLADGVDVAMNCFLQNILHCTHIVSSVNSKLNAPLNRSDSYTNRTATKVKKLKSHYRKTADFSALLTLSKINIKVNEYRRLKSIREERNALDSRQKATALVGLLKRRNPKPGNNITHVIDLDGKEIQDPKLITEAFNAYFSSVYTITSNSCPCINLMQLTSDSLSRIDLELNAVKSLVANIKPSCMPGPDGVPPVAIRSGGSDIPLLLLSIYNLSLSSGVFPRQWKTSVIIPRHKGGPLDDIRSFRPINHTPIASRTLERIVKNALDKYLERNCLINASQHGFLSRRSCMTCQVDFLNTFTSAADSGHSVIVILLDMQKAFDRVPHSHLLAKLQAIGICDPLLSWFSSFLKDREQIVCIGNSYSDPTTVSSGVVQGSVLGPLLFLIYINDICNVISHGCPFLFADDIKLVYTFHPNSLVEALINIQVDLDSLTEWSNTWLIKFSPTKSNVLTYKCVIPCGSILIDGEQVAIQNSVRDLGIRYSSSLNFSEQVSFQLAKARKSFGFITKSFTLPAARLEMYKIYVRPLLEYCSIIFGNLRKQDRLAIESFQRAVTKSVVGYSSSLTYRERCLKLSVEPLWLRRLKLNINFLHGLIYKHTHTAVRNMNLEQNKLYNLRNKSNTMSVPLARTNLRARFFLVRYSSLWNMIPSEIRAVSNPIIFKKRLHDFLNHSRILELFKLSLTEDGLFENGLDYV